jgi:uncharacterized protein YqeY
MNIRERIQQDITSSLKAGMSQHTLVLRTLLGVIQNAETSGKEKQHFDDLQIIALLQKERKKRLDTSSEYQKYGAHERSLKELMEVGIIDCYLPKMLTDAELALLIDEVFTNFESPTIRDMGNIMRAVNDKANGRADGKTVSEMVKAKLS